MPEEERAAFIAEGAALTRPDLPQEEKIGGWRRWTSSGPPAATRADKTALLVRALQRAHHDTDPDFTGWRDLDHMFGDWAAHLSDPRNRVLLRRVFGTVDDYPELIKAYFLAIMKQFGYRPTTEL